MIKNFLGPAEFVSVLTPPLFPISGRFVAGIYKKEMQRSVFLRG